MAIKLTARTGQKPATGPVIPHQQLSQNAPVDLQESLWQRMIQLPHVITGPSLVSAHDTRALHLQPAYARGPAGSLMVGTEFAHLHGPGDGSLHMMLPPALVTDIIAKGWGEVHPIARSQPSPALVMIFGPRDADELETVWQLVRASYDFAAGTQGADTPSHNTAS